MNPFYLSNILQIKDSFTKFQPFLQSLPDIIDTRSTSIIHQEFQKFKNHALDKIILEQAEILVDERMEVLKTLTFRDNTDEDFQRVSSKWEKDIEDLKEQLKETASQAAITDEQKQELDDVSDDIEDMEDDIAAINSDVSGLLAEVARLKEESAARKLKADLVGPFMDGTVACGLGGISIILSLGGLAAIYKKSVSKSKNDK